ncbi:MAG: purine-nucleoside phosphorylase [Planctomycetes bacterium]|nr:purine-nucleoside phosphorylase [Planctomycetota bacterium]
MPSSSVVADAAGALRARLGKARKPKVAIVLGTGLGGLSARIECRVAVSYEEIPHFPVSTVASHAGDLVFGAIGGTPIVAMDGRFHYYEGYDLAAVTLPVRVMRALGARFLVVTNACGALNPNFHEGDLMAIDDHIALFGPNPLIGPNDDRQGPRFPDMIEPYDKDLIARAERIALAAGIRMHRGVYVWVTGPSLETRAEYRMLRLLGADVVGMSTVPEVIAAAHAGFRTVGFSIVTDRCLPDALRPVDIKQIIATANAAEPRLTRVVADLVSQLR